LSAIVVGNISGMKQKGVDPKVEEDMKVKMREENRNVTDFTKFCFFLNTMLLPVITRFPFLFHVFRRGYGMDEN
jgi:hypothetical protein